MHEYPIKHLVLVRHGESEGDVRRAQTNQPTSDRLTKHPRDEEQTERGHEQSSAAGQWIAKFVLEKYGIESFDWQRTSPLIRTRQSAGSLAIGGEWQGDERLAERDRGLIQGMTKKQHQGQFPRSFQTMHEYPFYWVPPQGESLLRVSMRFGELVKDFIQSDATFGLFMTHRDVLWAAHISVDNTSLEEIENIDTDSLHNSHVVHYTNVNPYEGTPEAPDFQWKRSVTPWMSGAHQDETVWSSLEGRTPA